MGTHAESPAGPFQAVTVYCAQLPPTFPDAAVMSPRNTRTALKSPSPALGGAAAGDSELQVGSSRPEADSPARNALSHGLAQLPRMSQAPVPHFHSLLAKARGTEARGERAAPRSPPGRWQQLCGLQSPGVKTPRVCFCLDSQAAGRPIRQRKRKGSISGLALAR